MQTNNRYPEIVYKYRNWVDDTHKNVLLRNELFFSSPRDFNDPFDCRIPLNFSLLDSEEKLSQYLSYGRQRREAETTMSKEDLDDMMSKFELRLRTERDKTQEFYNSLYFEGVDNHYGVLSLTEKWNSILMWSHYGDCHRGYCVGFWQEKFRKSGVVNGGVAIYPEDNSFPGISPIDQNETKSTIQQVHTKSNEWKYESEFRLYKMFYPETATVDARIHIVSDDYFAEINIGLSASVETQNALIEIAKAKNIPVYRLSKVLFKFEVAREQIL